MTNEACAVGWYPVRPISGPRSHAEFVPDASRVNRLRPFDGLKRGRRQTTSEGVTADGRPSRKADMKFRKDESR